MPELSRPNAARLLVLVNPTAGHGRARRVAPDVAGYLRSQGAVADFAESCSSDDLEQRAAQAAEQGYTHVAALGGDGAFHHLLNGAFGHPVALGFFPCGNGNDIALGLEIPTEPVAAAHAFLRAAPAPADVLRARCAGGRERLFIGAGGMGLDAEAAQLVHGRFRRLPGVVRYVAAALWVLTSYEPMEMRIEIDGRPWSGRPLFAAVANSPSYGAGVKIEPAARMDDGWLNLVLVGDMPWTKLVEAIPPVLLTGDVRLPEIERHRARHLRLEASRKALLHGDGELLGEAPAEIEVLPGAVRIGGTGLSGSAR
jgi:diacylglycerol kinase (ATP)